MREVKKNRHASELGKLAKGKKKTLTEEDKAARSERLKTAREKRWNKSKP